MSKFNIGDTVVATSNSMSMRLNDPKLSAYFEGYAYSSERKIVGNNLKIVNTFDEELEKDGKEIVTHYAVCCNFKSKYKELYIINEEILDYATIEMTANEIEEAIGENGILIDEGSGADTVEYPTIESLKNKLVKMVNGTVYFGATNGFINSNQRIREYENYNEKLESYENPSFDVDKVYNVTDPIQICTFTPNEETLTWVKPHIYTLNEINKKLGYKVKLKIEG